MRRAVQSELLDQLAPEHPEAVGSRKDLVFLNSWMGNARIAAKLLIPLIPGNRPARLADIGCGDCAFLARVLRNLSRNGIRGSVVANDRQNVIKQEFIAEAMDLGWTVTPEICDAMEWAQDDTQQHDVVFANLFMHHFNAPELESLFGGLSRKTNAFVALDPRRWRPALFVTKLLWLAGCNRVTQHDAIASVRAGFANEELSPLWPDRENWHLREFAATVATHVFVAARK